MTRRRVLILGAAGRDFHNFNCFFRDNDDYEVVAFTAAQIPDIDGRTYPAELAGELYPEGVPILSENDLEDILFDLEVDEAVFAYSDISHEDVMHLASRVLAVGADFRFMGGDSSSVGATVPVVSICAVRTGCGKSQTTRRVVEVLEEAGKKVVVIRHPMPYGDLTKQAVQRFETPEDLDEHECTIEEREEYEPHLRNGVVVYAGVDYAEIVAAAEQEAEIIVWDGGNNDLPLVDPDFEIVVTDPHRAGHEISYHPGETNLRRADVVVINKIDTADPEDVHELRRNIAETNPEAIVVDAASPLFLDGDPEQIRGKRVLVVEDGPTLTHGEMAYGAGVVAAVKYGAAELVDARDHAVGSIADTYARYPQAEVSLPAMGYGDEQIRELEATINASEPDLVLVATPIDLRHLIDIDAPAIRVSYELQELGRPTLSDVLADFLAELDD